MGSKVGNKIKSFSYQNVHVHEHYWGIVLARTVHVQYNTILSLNIVNVHVQVCTPCTCTSRTLFFIFVSLSLLLPLDEDWREWERIWHIVLYAHLYSTHTCTCTVGIVYIRTFCS